MSTSDDAEPVVVSRYIPLLSAVHGVDAVATNSSQPDDVALVAEGKYTPPTLPEASPSDEHKETTIPLSPVVPMVTAVPVALAAAPFTSFKRFLTLVVQERQPGLGRVDAVRMLDHLSGLPWHRRPAVFPQPWQHVLYGCMWAIRGESHYAHQMLVPYLKKHTQDPLGWIGASYAEAYDAKSAIDAARRAVLYARQVTCEQAPQTHLFMVGMAILAQAEALARHGQLDECLLCLRSAIDDFGIRYAMLARALVYRLQGQVSRCACELDRIDLWLKREWSTHEHAEEHWRIKKLVVQHRQWVQSMRSDAQCVVM